MMSTMVAGNGGYYMDTTNPPGHPPLEVMALPQAMCTPPQHPSPPSASSSSPNTSTTTSTTTSHVVTPLVSPMDMVGNPPYPPPPYGSNDYYTGEYYSNNPSDYCPHHHSICALHGMSQPPGPSTIRMVSTNTSPPIPLPMQVQPGHVMHQIVDETGALQQVILSHNTMPIPIYCGLQQTNPGQGHQTFYGPPPPSGPPPQGYIPPYQSTGYNAVMSPPLTQPSPPPTINYTQKMDRHTSRSKFDPSRAKFLPRHQQSSYNVQNNKSSTNSSLQSTPQLSPKKETLGSNSGAVHEDDNYGSNDDFRICLHQVINKLKTPEVSSITPRGALAHWSAPDVNGVPQQHLHEIDDLMTQVEYQVFLNDGKIATTTNATTFEITDLNPGQDYRVHLVCCCDGSLSDPTSHKGFTTLPDKPDAPPPVKVVEKSKTSLLCKWTHGKDNGSRISTYLLQMSEDGKGEWADVFRGRSKQYNINKLKPQTAYQIRIAAINDLGQSTWSIETLSSTSGTAPKQPVPPSLDKSTINSLTVAWQRIRCEEFVLQMEDCENQYGFLNVYSGIESRFTCIDLRRNTDYKFRLCAMNEDGTSPYSETASYRTLPDRPKSPSPPSTKGKIYPTKLTLVWTPPYDNGGSPVNNFRVELDRGKDFVCLYDGPQMEYECLELTPGTSYRVRARAMSAGGASDWSASSIVTTEPVCPKQCQPPQLLTKPKACTLQLKWGPPENNGGSAVTEYHVDMTSPDNDRRQVYCGRDTQCTVASLLHGRPYIFLVRALNRVGPGCWSEPLEAVSGAGPPDVPHPPHLACRGPHAVQIAWDEPINNGAGIETFSIQMAEVSNPSPESSESSSTCGDSETDLEYSSAYSGPVTSTTTEIKNLLPATTYSFRINATNSAGSGPWSAATQVTTPAAAPSPIPYVSLTPSASSVSLHWTEPPCNGDPITHYVIDVSDHASVTTIGPELDYVVEDLSPETTYKFRIQAVNSVGLSTLSSSHKVTTKPLPPQPPCLEVVKASYNSLRIKWGDNRNTDMLKYCLQMEFLNSHKSMEFYPVYNGMNQNFRLGKLEEMSGYRLRISASNEAGVGPFSEPAEFFTSKATPAQLKGPRVTIGPESTFCIEWCGVKSPSEDEINYRLQLQKAGKGQEYSVVYYGLETSHVLSDLEANSGYYVRVCGVRVCGDGDTMAGAYSSPTLFNTPEITSVSSVDTATAATKTEKGSLWNRLSDQEKAAIYSFSFFLLALFVTYVLLLSNSVDSSVDSSKQVF